MRSAVMTVSAAFIGSIAAVSLLAYQANLGSKPVIFGAAAGLLLAATVLFALAHADRSVMAFGVANMITTARAGMTLLLAAVIPVAALLDGTMLWTLTAIAGVALVLDGVDGYIARKRHECSAFGARFDMEVDALLALIMCLLLWRSGETGVWVLGLGIMRYLFIAAGWKLPALQVPLYPSFRRKAVCVIQIGALAVMLSPIIDGTLSLLVGASALICLLASFTRDTMWLLSHRHGLA